MIFEERDFHKRLRQSISTAWVIFKEKVSNELIAINKEASMQLHYANILYNFLPQIIFEKDEEAIIHLEKSVTLSDNTYCEVDLLLEGIKNKCSYKIAVEMKCYRELAASGGKRGATDIFLKDVYIDLETLEKYIESKVCNDKVLLVMNDLERLVYPKGKSAKCWNYDISNDFKIQGPINITTPIGGKEQDITIKNNYTFNWDRKNNFFFLEL